MIDLHAGVLELFAEAQHLGRPPRLRPPLTDKTISRLTEKARLRRVDRAIRRARSPSTPTQPILILPVTCPLCGGDAVLRLGSTRPVHPNTPHGSCPTP